MNDRNDRQNLVLSGLDKLSPDEWLTFMRLFAPAMCEADPDFLIEILVREAERRAHGIPTHRPAADDIAGVLRDVGVKLSPA